MTEQEQIKEAFEDLLKSLRKETSKENRQKIKEAFEFANEAHKGVKRRSGEPYILHPLAVAKIAVKEIGLGTTSVISALLHDVVEDTDYTVEDIANLFGPKVASIVDGLTKISGVMGSDTSRQAESFRKMILTLADDVRVILIKISDRLHNMRTMEYQSPAKQKQKSLETMEIYAPISHRLGMQRIKWELEDTSLKYLDPVGYEEISRQLDEKERIRQERLLETERKRIERATRKKKLSRAELKEKAKTDPEAAEQWAAMKAKEAEARQRKKEREEARIASDPEYAAMMAERKAEYTRTRTAKRKAEHDALVELARTDPEAARQLAEKRKYQSEATTKSRQKMKAAAEAGDPDAIRRYEAYLAKRREDYHKKNQSKEEISA